MRQSNNVQQGERPRGGPDWWQGAVIYHIYPRSFADSSGNGVGDLEGIRRRLDYIQSLGVDALWISPFVTSPMLDFGYDVSDYLSVDPLFGSLEDFSRLLEEAHQRGLRVLMDQVLSHTSNQHPWFLESRASRDNERADWYVWADPRSDGTPPNNWLSVFGGSSWQWEPRRRQYYLHNFLREQPDLNFHHPGVQDALLDVCRYWLELGVDGFRLDVCAFYFHDRSLRDNPPNSAPLQASHFLFNPYSMQRHVHDIAQPENLAFLERLRALCDEFEDRVLLGELHENEGERLHREYTAAGRLQLAYGYWFLGADSLDASTIGATARELGHALDSGWPCWALDNHDFARSPTRLGKPDATVVHLAALSCLRGAMCLYQGSELGLPNADVPLERLIDPYGREFYPAFQGRDGARTPMPWQADAPHCGFSPAEPWLPIPGAHVPLSVDRQQTLPGSTLNRLSRFLNWRRQMPALLRGSMQMLATDDPVLAFERSLEGERVVCVFNFSDREARIQLPRESLGIACEGHGFGATEIDGLLTLPAHGAWFGVHA